MKAKIVGLVSAALLCSVTVPAAADAKGASKQLDSVKGSNSKVVQFLQDMPKGGDLHMHMSGAVYAESMVDWGAADGICLNTTTMAAAYPPCETGEVPLSTVPTNSTLYDRVIATWSMRGFTPSIESGHDHFFAVFPLISPTLGGTRYGDVLSQITKRASDQGEQYLEAMTGPDFSGNKAVAAKVPYNSDFALMRQQMIEAGLFNALPSVRQWTDSIYKRREQLQHCGTAQADDACDVRARFLAQISRDQPLNVVFAQMAFVFEVAKTDRRWAGINIVGPEDGLYAVRDYRTHMQMLQYLRTLYPDVKMSLHAGELWPGMVPPSDLRFHVRAAVKTAGADRIGHGVDLRWERHPNGLMKTMRKRKTCVEINLTSNRQILGVKGKKHPIRDYWKHGVRIVLSTDDEGIERTDLTHQYAQAVNDHGFGYSDLKQIAKNAITCSFLPSAAKQKMHKQQRKMFADFESRY